VLDDVLVSAEGPSEDPPTHGAIVCLVDPDGHIVYDTPNVLQPVLLSTMPRRPPPTPDLSWRSSVAIEHRVRIKIPARDLLPPMRVPFVLMLPSSDRRALD
jgi:hypothetical protein